MFKKKLEAISLLIYQHRWMNCGIFPFLFVFFIGCGIVPRNDVDMRAYPGKHEWISSESRIYHSKLSRSGTLVIIPEKNADIESWHKTILKTAYDIKNIVVLDFKDTEISSNTQAGFKTIITELNLTKPSAILAVKDRMNIGLKLAELDTNIVALLALTPDLSWHKKFNIDIPFILFASRDDPEYAYQDLHNIFKELDEPKRFIMFATDINGQNLLSTHMEPIIRRVVKMTVEKYIK